MDIDLTLGLDAIGLRNSRLELGFFVQDSSVTDPVTGADRSLSGERDFRGRISYRQEFPSRRVSWGASVFDGSARTSYGLDELESSDSQMELTMFLEKVVLDTIKIRFRELRNRTEGREFSLSLSRTF